MRCWWIILVWMTIIVMGCGGGRGDFAKDKAECQNQLVSLTSCLGFISGEGKEPSNTCCLKLIQNFNESRRCLCILIRDRNQPNLGFKVNATLALTLPFLCHIPANETQCLGTYYYVYSEKILLSTFHFNKCMNVRI